MTHVQPRCTHILAAAVSVLWWQSLTGVYCCSLSYAPRATHSPESRQFCCSTPCKAQFPSTLSGPEFCPIWPSLLGAALPKICLETSSLDGFIVNVSCNWSCWCRFQESQGRSRWCWFPLKCAGSICVIHIPEGAITVQRTTSRSNAQLCNALIGWIHRQRVSRLS